MGDFFLMHDETGKRYFRRLIYINILFYVLVVIIFIVTTVNIVILLSLAFIGSVISLFYVAYFIYRNPPKDYSEELE